jgi:carbon monoxide dehydrogenase subunit G
MEVKLDKRYPLAVSVGQAWAVLADIRAVAACMPGAQITEQIDDTHFKGVVKSKIGPATMMFNGDIELLGRDAVARSLQMVGKGSDKGGSSASMNLAAHIEAGDSGGSSVLVGQATVNVGGKLAQFGGRLIVPVSEAMLAQFADNFRVAAAAKPAGVEAAAAVSPAPSSDPPAVVPLAATVAAPIATPVPVAIAVPVAVAAPVEELDALALLWLALKSWFGGLFSRKSN